MTDTPSATAAAIDAVGVATTVILELSKGQQVWISPGTYDYDMTGTTANGIGSWFAGHLLLAY